MAVGAILKVYDVRCKVGAEELASNVRPYLSMDEWSGLREVYDTGVAVITSLFSMKVAFSQRLPWVLVGVAHLDEEKARRCVDIAVGVTHQRMEGNYTIPRRELSSSVVVHTVKSWMASFLAQAFPRGVAI